MEARALIHDIILLVFGVLILSVNGTRYRNQSYAYSRKIVEANITLTDNYFENLLNMAKIIVSDRDILNAVNYREKTNEIDYSIELYNQRKVAQKMLQLDVLGHVKNAYKKLNGSKRNPFSYFNSKVTNNKGSHC